MLQGSIEDNCLTAICWNERLAPQLALKLKATDFSTNVYRRIATAGLDFLERHHRPARTHIGDILEHDIVRGPDGRFTEQLIAEMARLAPGLDEDFVLTELDKFLEIQQLTTAISRASDFLASNDLEQAREILRAPALLPKDKPGVWLGDRDWFGFLHEEDDEDQFSCGIPTLDDYGIRPGRGELFILLAASGRGKSWFLINAGKHNVNRRKKVLHITLENTLDMTLQRYTQCFLSLTKDEARNISVPIFRRDKEGHIIGPPEHDNPLMQSIYTVPEEEMSAKLEQFTTRGKLLVKHFPTGALGYGHLVSYLDTLELVHGFKPDLVLLDYLTLMDVGNSRDFRLSLGKLTQNLRGLASMRNFALVTVAQGNRLSDKARQVTANHVAEDWSIVATSDTLLTYSQTDGERDRKMARILVNKSRKSADKWTASITQAYDIGQFALDSEYMSKYLESELSQEDEDDRA